MIVLICYHCVQIGKSEVGLGVFYVDLLPYCSNGHVRGMTKGELC